MWGDERSDENYETGCHVSDTRVAASKSTGPIVDGWAGAFPSAASIIGSHKMTSHSTSFWSRVRRFAHAAAVPVLLFSTACNGSDAAGAAAGAPGSGPPMAMGVEALTLAAKPVERTSEYVATVKSRR